MSDTARPHEASMVKAKRLLWAVTFAVIAIGVAWVNTELKYPRNEIYVIASGFALASLVAFCTGISESGKRPSGLRI